MKVILIILAIIPGYFCSGLEGIWIKANTGAAFPIEDFRDLNKFYNNCSKDGYSKSSYFKISSTVMSDAPTYDFDIMLGLNKYFNLKFNINYLKSFAKGIEAVTNEESQLLFNPNGVKSNPYFSAIGTGFGLGYNFFPFSRLNVFICLNPQVFIINFNSYAAINAVPKPYVREEKNDMVKPGISFVVGVDYKLFGNLKADVSLQYEKIYAPYNHQAISTSLFCFPVDNPTANPSFIIFTIGLKYELFDLSVKPIL